MRIRIHGFLIIFMCLIGLTAKQSTPDHELLVIVGAAGEDSYAEGFEEAAQAWGEASKAANASITFIGREEDTASTDRERIHAWIQKLDTETLAPAWIVYIGHGTYNRRDAYLNLTGPDLSAKDLARWLPSMDRTLIFVHGGSAASP
ncbi:MAG: hypothetical protein O7C75_07535, partial [Verrucomicrobia bacterium]|nr:hypothetical protein [Verrucomicrobiota bacterium]